MNAWRALFALMVFPGLLYALPMGWFMLGAGRKLVARFQGRIGPPISQPFNPPPRPPLRLLPIRRRW